MRIIPEIVIDITVDTHGEHQRRNGAMLEKNQAMDRKDIGMP